MDNYYQQALYIPQVDKNDQIIGPVERWQAHKKAILHHGFTVILKYQKKYLLQHRKHPVFNNVLDLSFSSHPIYEKEKLQDDITAIYQSLKREWQLDKKDLLGKIKKINQFYYKVQDKKSGYWEHEIDYIYIADLARLPHPNYNYAYGFSLVEKDFLKSSPQSYNSITFAPWVNPILKKI